MFLLQLPPRIRRKLPFPLYLGPKLSDLEFLECWCKKNGIYQSFGHPDIDMQEISESFHLSRFCFILGGMSQNRFFFLEEEIGENFKL